MEILKKYRLILIFMTLWRQTVVSSTYTPQMTLTVDEVQAILIDEHSKALAEIDCPNRILSYLSYACDNGDKSVSEKMHNACVSPFSYINRMCGTNDDLKRLLLTVRDRRKSSGNGNSQPPVFTMSKGRRTDTSQQLREQRKSGPMDTDAAGSEDFPDIYVNRFLGSRG